MTEVDIVIHDTGDVFHALGLSDADDLLLRAERLMLVGEMIADRGLQRHEIRALLKTSRSEISALVRGEISKFSQKRLTQILNDLKSGFGSAE